MDGAARMRRLALILVATYPDGSIGSVAAFKPLDGVEGDLFTGDRAHPLVDEAIDNITALYHATIGQAYGPDDFAYTIYDIADDTALFELVGARMLATEGAVSSIQRPLAIGPNR